MTTPQVGAENKTLELDDRDIILAEILDRSPSLFDPILSADFDRPIISDNVLSGLVRAAFNAGVDATSVSLQRLCDESEELQGLDIAGMISSIREQKPAVEEGGQ